MKHAQLLLSKELKPYKGKQGGTELKKRFLEICIRSAMEKQTQNCGHLLLVGNTVWVVLMLYIETPVWCALSCKSTSIATNCGP